MHECQMSFTYLPVSPYNKTSRAYTFHTLYYQPEVTLIVSIYDLTPVTIQSTYPWCQSSCPSLGRQPTFPNFIKSYIIFHISPYLSLAWSLQEPDSTTHKLFRKISLFSYPSTILIPWSKSFPNEHGMMHHDNNVIIDIHGLFLCANWI